MRPLWLIEALALLNGNITLQIWLIHLTSAVEEVTKNGYYRRLHLDWYNSPDW